MQSQRINIDRSASKKEVDNALRKILFNDQVIDSFCTMFRYELAILPIELETLLGCSRSERLRWTKEKKIPIVYFKDVYKFGAHLMCPMFDCRIIGLQLSDKIIAAWRDEWTRRRRKKYKVGDKQYIRKISIFEDVFYNNINMFCDKWYSIDQELGIVFELSYWLGILNYWINDRKYRTTTSRTHYYDHKYIERIFEGYRESVIYVLLKSKYTNISLYHPPRKDRFILKLCDKHNTYVYNNNEIIHAYEDFYLHPQIYINCSNCTIIQKHNYFSLWCIKISSSLDNDFLFIFYIPYNFLNISIDNIQEYNYKQYNEGVFYQGREMIKNNIFIPTENKTVNRLKELYINAKNFLKKGDNIF